MHEPLVIQRPPHPPGQLILLFHGVGSTPQSMAALGQRLGAEAPRAVVLGVPGPDASDMGPGYQWFSVRGITESNRAERIAATMPRFVETIRALQKSTGVIAAQCVLVGFSQGAIMALESTKVDNQLAGRIVAIAGRFAQDPDHGLGSTTVHFIHGKSDPVIDYGHSVTAAERLGRLGADVTVDVIEALGHGINTEAVNRMVDRLKAGARNVSVA